jgi:hypothetical protein
LELAGRQAKALQHYTTKRCAQAVALGDQQGALAALTFLSRTRLFFRLSARGTGALGAGQNLFAQRRCAGRSVITGALPWALDRRPRRRRLIRAGRQGPCATGHRAGASPPIGGHFANGEWRFVLGHPGNARIIQLIVK